MQITVIESSVAIYRYPVHFSNLFAELRQPKGMFKYRTII